jgi:lipoate-protein ligase A
MIQVIKQQQGDPDLTGEALRYGDLGFKVWEPKTTLVVLGNSQEATSELNTTLVLEDNIPVYKRIGGGGAVVLSPGTLCYALALPKMPAWQIADYFNSGSGVLKHCLKRHLNLNCEAKGISDLSVANKKIMGCSMYMPRDRVLYLASVLVEDRLDLIDRYLAHPSAEPDYRAGRSHREFLTNLRTLSNISFTLNDLKNWIETEIKESIRF